jgi:hypothetical protein
MIPLPLSYKQANIGPVAKILPGSNRPSPMLQVPGHINPNFGSDRLKREGNNLRFALPHLPGKEPLKAIGGTVHEDYQSLHNHLNSIRPGSPGHMYTYNSDPKVGDQHAYVRNLATHGSPTPDLRYLHDSGLWRPIEEHPHLFKSYGSTPVVKSASYEGYAFL